MFVEYLLDRNCWEGDGSSEDYNEKDMFVVPPKTILLVGWGREVQKSYQGLEMKEMAGDQCDKDGGCWQPVSNLRISITVHAACISFAKERIKIL